MKITKLETFNAGAGWPSFSVFKVSKGAFYQLREGTPNFLGILDFPADALD